VAERRMEEGMYFPAFFSGILEEKDIRLFNKLLLKVVKGESKQIEVSFKPKRKLISMEIFLNPIFDTEGNITEISLVAHDITEKKKVEKEIVESLKEKEVLLKEIHHRVKNNLQVISSILNLQSSFVKDKKTLEILEESRNRIRSMAIIHENLYQTTNFSSIDFSSYLENLCSNLISSYHLYSGAVQLHTELEKVELVLDQAIPCGLLVNELITNSLKYAFPEGRSGEISVQLFEKNNRINLRIGDDGIGMPEDYDILNSDTLGLQLVSTLVEQLDGEIHVDNSKGIKYLITFEKAKL
jgi:two-component sensor histidine kinase